MRKVTIKVQRTYTKEAEVTIDLPYNVVLDHVDDFLYVNRGLYEKQLENNLKKQDFAFEDETTRYDVKETVTLTRHIWGGTL
jgi:hypothetical protein